MKLRLWTLHVSHRHGDDTTIHATEAAAHAAMADWARRDWPEIVGQDGVPEEAPEDDEEAIRVYFDHQDDEWADVGFAIVDVDGAEVVEEAPA